MTRKTDIAASAHIDTFARDHLPPPEQWPDLRFDLPELQYPARLNAAVELLDKTVAAGMGGSLRSLAARNATANVASASLKPVSTTMCSSSPFGKEAA